MCKVVDVSELQLGGQPRGLGISSPAAHAPIRIRTSTTRSELPSAFHYYGYRQLNPLTGRWVSRDPIEEEGGVNLYGFLGNNPTDSWDYLGLTESEWHSRYSDTIPAIDGCAPGTLMVIGSRIRYENLELSAAYSRAVRKIDRFKNAVVAAEAATTIGAAGVRTAFHGIHAIKHNMGEAAEMGAGAGSGKAFINFAKGETRRFIRNSVWFLPAVGYVDIVYYQCRCRNTLFGTRYEWAKQPTYTFGPMLAEYWDRIAQVYSEPVPLRPYDRMNAAEELEARICAKEQLLTERKTRFYQYESDPDKPKN
jgi:RHS repeat-associated protein